MIMMMSIRGDFMRDNQPKISEAAAAPLRSGEVEPGRGWSSGAASAAAGWPPASSP